MSAFQHTRKMEKVSVEKGKEYVKITVFFICDTASLCSLDPLESPWDLLEVVQLIVTNGSPASVSITT